MCQKAKRIHVYYSGRVQGVGFRFSCERAAADLGLSGWVKNLSDGRVELVCEADEQSLKQFLQKIDSEFSGLIRQKNISWSAATGEFTSFEIKFF